MTLLANHPTVRSFEANPTAPLPREASLDAAELRRLCLELGADDVGFVELDRAELADQRNHVLAAFPRARTYISYVVRMNRASLRTPARSVANLEFHDAGEEVDQVGHRIAAELERRGIEAINPAMGFPMEMEGWPGRLWVVSHKPVAVAAGLGKMGIHRNVIHPRFGNFILLGTVITEARIAEHSQPIDFNPCLECKLCVAACPTGAISPQGDFNFSACYKHNYREFRGGFTDWVETVADSRTARHYRKTVSDAETVSLWQSLGFGPNYKAAYCLAVCPAGEEVIGPFLREKASFVQEVVKPLQEKEETIYVVPGSDAEEYVVRRFPWKSVQHVGNSLRPQSIEGFLTGVHLTFQPGQALGLDATYHFTFRGEEPREATVVIRDRRLEVHDGHVGAHDFHLRADSRTWLRFLAGDVKL
ncbi:MAG: 4Fe-4S binding protein, partial [Acidobacteria bacterium]|nr:4Fe-4S binding protein [Acidobacteriota bacterium]